MSTNSVNELNDLTEGIRSALTELNQGICDVEVEADGECGGCRDVDVVTDGGTGR